MKDILKCGIWIGIYSLLIVPFIVADTMFFPYITGKAFTFRIIVEIIFALWLILIMKDKEFRPKWSWVLGAAGIFTFILLMADIQAVAPYKAFWSNYERMEGFVTFAHLMAYLLVLSSMLNRENLWLWFLRVTISSPYLYVVYKYFKFPINKTKGLISENTNFIDYIHMSGERFSGPLGNPIYIAVFFLFLFFFTLILLYKDVLAKKLTDWNLFKKVFANILFYVYIAVSALSLFVVYRTSRGALLGAIGGIFMGALLIAIFEKERKVIRQIAIGGIIAVIAVVVVFMGVRDTAYVKNNPTLSRLAEVSWSNVNGQARQLIWPMALKGFKEKPILGWGQEGFNYVFNKYYDPKMYGQESWFDRAHNAPLDFLVAGGILGFLSYFGLFASALYLLWFRKNGLSISERGLLTGLFAGYLFQAIFVFDNLVSYVMFFTALAYVHSRVTEDLSVAIPVTKKGIRQPEEVQGHISAFVQNEEYQNYILIPVVAVLSVVGVWWINIPSINANKNLIQALRMVQSGKTLEGLESFKAALAYQSLGDSEIREQLISYTPQILKSAEVSNEIKKEFLTLTVNEVEKQITRVPNDARYYILMGSLLNNIGNPAQAETYVRRAIELSPSKQTMRFELVQSLYALGKSTEAMNEAKAAYELDTRFEQAKTIYKATIENEIRVNPNFKVEGEEILTKLSAK